MSMRKGNGEPITQLKDCFNGLMIHGGLLL